MALKLYGNPFSTCTRRVITVLKEYNVPYEMVVIDFSKGEHKAPGFVEHQPFGQVPYIVDNDLEVYESRAICRYIAEKYRGKAVSGKDLVPLASDLKAFAKFEQAVSIESSNFDPFAGGIALERVYKPLKGINTNEPLVVSYIAILEGKLDAYEKIFSKQKYLAGDDITIADLFHLPYGTMLPQQGVDALENAQKRPNVARWWKELISRPSWIAATSN
ncbi:glutathione S-transferase [Abortiporus biennis]|nr:glutathione S-transferase [Abortiporus biennis]